MPHDAYKAIAKVAKRPAAMVKEPKVKAMAPPVAWTGVRVEVPLCLEVEEPV